MSAETHREAETSSKDESKKTKQTISSGRLKKLWTKLWATKKRRVITIVSAVVVVLGVLFAVPYTRYAVAGIVIKKSAAVTIVDSVSGKPISEALVDLAGQTVKTDAQGEARFSSVPAGEYNITVSKKYYQGAEQSFTVPILATSPNAKLAMKATGRTVLLKVTNKISGAVLGKAKVSVSDTAAITDENGEASVVLPISDKVQKAKIETDGYNAAETELKVTNADNQKYNATLTPVGKVYYLSKRTGRINVVKSNLDGSDQQVVLEGTGREVDYQTSLLASRDWKYLALLAKRDSDKPKIYLINTSTDKLSVIDEGDADFQLAGWSDHRFIYSLTRKKPNVWDDKRQALKSFDAESTQLVTLDETSGKNNNQYDYAYEELANIYILKDRIVYTKDWNLAYYAQKYANKKAAIMSIKSNGENKQRVKEFSEESFVYLNARLYAPEEIYFFVGTSDSKTTFYEYENGKVVGAGIDQDKYHSYYPTYLISPSGGKTFWFEPRDGKNTLFVGDADAENSKEIASVTEYTPYGWFSDDYLLVSKKGSELYIMSRNHPKNEPVKVSDYHRPGLSYPGYGRGYGGF